MFQQQVSCLFLTAVTEQIEHDFGKAPPQRAYFQIEKVFYSNQFDLGSL